MNKFRLFALKKLPLRQRVKAASKKGKLRATFSSSPAKMPQQIRRVARRVGVVLGFRPKQADETLIVITAQPKSSVKKPGNAKKKVRFEVQSEPSSKKIKRILRKACQYVTLGAMVSAPGILVHPTEPNLATSHRSSWSSWTEPVNWSNSGHLFI
ncbi:uncharacterized protein LOC115326833 [Ixodes scapularis]|uniref:Uncharacterized protein n=1 Tax=Ixodes scapularis TaxID=6945 RepID=B7Q7K7_IXOSC|nr:uncharacterized protein LOC115326833 [Ixodes scapularis]EEC14829.1 hypothetical protein IscW_ISCW010953 [Ixodes scapularis]|eukprot:XP_002404155.1 hypothetical protein IscW_ISCW010953 [Ixodes scapularis]